MNEETGRYERERVRGLVVQGREEMTPKAGELGSNLAEYNLILILILVRGNGSEEYVCALTNCAPVLLNMMWVAGTTMH